MSLNLLRISPVPSPASTSPAPPVPAAAARPQPSAPVPAPPTPVVEIVLGINNLSRANGVAVAPPADPNSRYGTDMLQDQHSVGANGQWSGTPVNWTITVPNLWTSAPQSGSDVVAVCNWAKQEGYQVRARGIMHTWSLLTVVGGTSTDPKLMLVDTAKYLTGMTFVPGSRPTARAA